MEILTVKKARKVLRDNNISWSWYQDLRQIELYANNAEVKSASKRLQSFILRG